MAGQQRPSVAYTNDSSQISDTVLLATKEMATDLKEGEDYCLPLAHSQTHETVRL